MSSVRKTLFRISQSLTRQHKQLAIWLLDVVLAPFSFLLAFRLALTAQNIGAVNRGRVYAALRQRVLRQPLSFVLPIRLKPPPGADSVPAAPPHDDGDSHSPKPPG